MYIPSGPARKRWIGTCIIFCVRLCIVCSFYSNGQFQGLNKRDEQQVWLSRFFYNQSINALLESCGDN